MAEIIRDSCCYPLRVQVVQAAGASLLLRAEHREEAFFLELAALEHGALRLRVYREAFPAPAYDYVTAVPQPAQAEIREEDGEITLSCRDYTVRIGRDPFFLSVLNRDGDLVYDEQLQDVDSVAEGFGRVPPLGFTRTTDGGWECDLNPVLHCDEHIYGLGERFTEFDHRGQCIRMWNYDTLGCRDHTAYKNIPFYVSSRGYGLFINSCEPVVFHVGDEACGSLHVHVPAPAMEAYLFVGTPREVVSAFMQLTGPAALPPDWSFGLWYSSGFQGASATAMLEDAEQFRARHIPCDVIHFDCYWLRDDMWCDFEWDEKMYPNHVGMLEQLHAMGYKICLWINPYVTIRTQMFEEGAQKGYFLKTPQGEPYTADQWHGLLSPCAILDVTYPEAVAWFTAKLRRILREGVDVLKTDFGEEIPADAVFHNGLTGLHMRNAYANLYNTIVYNTVKQEKGAGMVWGRSGSAGMQKFPVCWSGDPRSCYESMASTLRGGLSLAMSGVTFWSHDMGGFYGDVTPEVFVRWSQFGLFSSHSRLHGTSSRQPWHYGPRAEAIVSEAIRLRYRLMPYILRTARECVERGEPFLRPLCWAHPEDKTTAGLWDEYYFGDALLVAPVFGGDGARRDVYLPEGDWVDFHTGTAYKGGAWYTFHCPLETIPVFRRCGRPVELLDQAPDCINGKE